MKVKLPFLFVLIVCFSAIVNAQGVKVSGKIVENGSQKTLPGVGIIITEIKDSTQQHLTTTDIDGNFSVQGLSYNTSYRLKTSYLGFAELVRLFDTKNSMVNMGTIVLKQKSQLLNEVVVEGQKTPVVQKGDTTEMSASAYKVNVDANAQDLVQKMPGITVENGTVKAHGEDVKRVLLDGKNYFGEDAAMALQNLPAEIVDKVQVYNKMSDQSEFTGFDDGNSSKVLNIITRADRRKGENGTFTGGTDFVDKYQVSGRLNILRNTKKITFTGGANNINQAPFSTQDILGVLGGGGGRGGRGGGGGGGFIGRQSGINKPASFGLNYTNEISKKLTISGSYFFNMQDNHTNSVTSSQNTVQFGDTINRPVYSFQNSVSMNKNYNHRFDMKLEYTIDSANSLIWAPRFSTQYNKRGSNSNSYLHNILPDTVQYLDNNSSNSSVGYNYTNDLTFRHKFTKKGRTISLGTALSGNLNDGDGLSNYFTQYIARPDSTLNQKSDSKTNGTSFSANLAYTEPIGKISMLQLGYNATFSKNSTDRKVYNDSLSVFTLSENYSNVYESNYNTQRAGLTYMIRGGDKLIANAGIDYQVASLTANRTSPSNANVKGYFDNWMPNAFMTYKITKRSNLRFFYRTSTNSPSVTELQDVITKSGTLNFSQGDPKLKPQYSNNGVLNYRYSNPDNFSNFSFTILGNYTTKYIGTAIYYPTRDSVITSGNSSDIVTPAGNLQKPMNFNDAWNAMIFTNYGFLFKPIKCNLNFSGRLIYSNTPGSINNILNTTSNYALVGGVTIASNISKNADFLLSYMGTYNISDVKYFGDMTELESKMRNTSLSTNTWNHTLNLTSTFTFWERLVLQNSLSGIILTGYGSGYNQNYLLWNPALSLKVFKNKAGQVKVSVFDALQQNQSISHNVSALSISDSRTNILQRFVLFSFTYTLRNYQANDGMERHHDGFGPGGGGGRRFGGGRGGDF